MTSTLNPHAAPPTGRMKPRWDPCVVQNSAEFDGFVAGYLNQAARKVLLIGGAGFDPRARESARRIASCKACQLDAVFFREERLMDQPLLRPRADNAQLELAKILPQATFSRIEIIPDGVTAIGGRRAVIELSKRDLATYTDVFVDISALSCGVYFSLVAFFVAQCQRHAHLNLHLLVAEQPNFDHKINGIPSDKAAMLHGFKGEQSLDSNEEQALLWIPTLAPGNPSLLSKVYQFIHRKDTPIDVCPIMPFPGVDPRMPDRLYEEYNENLRTWNVDDRNFLYAAESDPLDAYRAIHQLVAERTKLFAALGGSQVVLSPLGNKMLSVGAMLAAIDLNLPVAMVESVGYDEQSDAGTACDGVELTHLWLCGAAYMKPGK